MERNTKQVQLKKWLRHQVNIIYESNTRDMYDNFEDTA